MNIVQRIENMLPKNGINNIAELERASKLSNGTIGKWRNPKHKPNMRSIEKVALALSVTTDCLLGRTDNPAPPDTTAHYVSSDEFKLIERYRRLPPEKQRAIDALIG